MQMSKRVNKTKHTVRPVNKPHGAKTRFAKPSKMRQKKQKRKQRQGRVVFDGMIQLKAKMEEVEMRMGGTSVNASKIIEAIQPKATVDENVQTLNAIDASHTKGDVDPVIVGEDLRPAEGNVNMTTEGDATHTEGDDLRSTEGDDSQFTEEVDDSLAAKSDWVHEEAEDVLEPEVNATTTRKLGMFGALCLGMRHTLVGQVVTAFDSSMTDALRAAVGQE